MDTKTPNESWSDTELQKSAATGDFAAFEILVLRYQKRIMGLAYRILGQHQDAEDAVQKTLLSLVEHIDTFRGESSVSTWILRIGVNHALKILRQRKSSRTVSLDENLDDSFASVPHPEYIADWRENPERLAEDRETRELLQKELSELDEKYRLVFVLRDIEGMSVKETAETLGISESNVKVRLLRARLKLREQFTKAFGDESTRVYPDHSHA